MESAYPTKINDLDTPNSSHTHPTSRKKRITTWCSDVHTLMPELRAQGRVESDHHIAMTEKVRRNCGNLFHGKHGKHSKQCDQEEISKDIRTDMNFIRSSCERENGHDGHDGHDGLARRLEQFTQATDDVRLHMEYGDCSARNLCDLKQYPRMQESRHLFVGGPSWEHISGELAEEDQLLLRWLDTQADRQYTPRPNTPLRKAVKDAASRDGLSLGHLRFEIDTYAERCRHAHMGVDDLINTANFVRLAERFCADLSYINRQWAGQAPQDNNRECRIRLGETIKTQQDVWFEQIMSKIGMLLSSGGNRIG